RAMRCDVDQVQLPDTLHRLMRNDQNLFFVERNPNPSEHPAINALGARSSDLYLEGSATGFCFRYDLADYANTLLVEILDLHFDRLADLQSVRERLADAGDQLHSRGVKERR